MDYGSWGHKELDTAEQLALSLVTYDSVGLSCKSCKVGFLPPFYLFILIKKSFLASPCGMWSLNHWTSREVPQGSIFFDLSPLTLLAMQLPIEPFHFYPHPSNLSLYDLSLKLLQ